MVNYKGDLIEEEDLRFDSSNRALRYGDGLFDTLRYSHGKIHFWEDHYFRLMASMRILRMEIPMTYSPEYLEKQMLELVEAHGLKDGAARLRLSVYRKPGGYYSPHSNDVEFYIELSPLTSQNYELNEEGLITDVFKDHHKPTGLLSNLKTTSAVLYVIAGIFARENDLDEVFLVNEKKEVTEAVSSNIFILRSEKLITPPLETGCLKGIMRQKVMEIALRKGLEVEEKAFSPFELQRADEVWLTNSIRGIQWVGQYKKKTFGKEKADEVLRSLNKMTELF